MLAEPAKTLNAPLDDAGRPLPTVAPDVVLDAAWRGTRSRSQAIADAAIQLFPLVLIAAAIAFVAPGLSLQQLLASISFGVVFWIIVIARYWSRSRDRERDTPAPPTLPRQAAWLAAHRHCGACGYTLHEVQPAASGLAVCPECGATWHRDRWTLHHRDLTSGLTVKAQLTTGGTDDRGVPFDSAPEFPPVWLDWPTTPKQAATHLVSRWHAEHAENRSRRLRRFAPLLAILWVALTACFIALMVSKGGSGLDALLQISLTSTAICAVAVYVVMRTTSGPALLKHLVLAERLCLSCGRPLPSADPAAPAQFDGCTICTHCGRAWKESSPS